MDTADTTSPPGLEPATTAAADTGDDDAGLLTDELLVEEISIDGMCGVY